MYEDIFQYYSDSFAGKVLYSLPGASIGIDTPTDNNGDGVWNSVETSIEVNKPITLTGRFFESAKGDICYQCTYSGQYGFIWKSELSLWSGTAQQSDGLVIQAQNILNELIGYHKTILENNLLCARILNYCKSNGIALPAEARPNLYTLQSRLNTRNEKIKATGVEQVQEGESPNFGVYNDELTAFMANPGIGIIPLIYVIVIAAIAVAATATSAIMIYKALHTEAKADFAYSNDLTAQLVKFLPPETYKQLLSENKANAKKAQDAIDAASGKSLFNTIKTIGIGVGAIWLFDKFMSSRKNN
jgi:hypothetical protein